VPRRDPDRGEGAGPGSGRTGRRAGYGHRAALPARERAESGEAPLLGPGQVLRHVGLGRTGKGRAGGHGAVRGVRLLGAVCWPGAQLGERDDSDVAVAVGGGGGRVV
jgi:hypothetical protein